MTYWTEGNRMPRRPFGLIEDLNPGAVASVPSQEPVEWRGSFDGSSVVVMDRAWASARLAAATLLGAPEMSVDCRRVGDAGQ